jgi:hypothetical protein
MVFACHGHYVKTTVYGLDDVDYSEYLGPDWRKNKFKGKNVSMSISNHISYIDGPTTILDSSLPNICPQFTPADFVGKLPIGGWILECCNAFYIKRTGT